MDTAHIPAVVLAAISQCSHSSSEINFCCLHFSSSDEPHSPYSHYPQNRLVLMQDLSLTLPLTSSSQTLIFRLRDSQSLSIAWHTTNSIEQGNCPSSLTRCSDQTPENLEFLTSFPEPSLSNWLCDSQQAWPEPFLTLGFVFLFSLNWGIPQAAW